MVTDTTMFELYVREYARLEFERAQLNSEEPDEMSKHKRLQDIQSEMRRREFGRFLSEQRSPKSAPGAERRVSPGWLNRRIDAVRHSFQFILARFFGARDPGRSAGKETGRASSTFKGE